PRGQRVALPKPRHRGQGRFPVGCPPYPGPSDLDAATAERQLRRRRAPVVMRALRLLPPLGPGQGDGLLAKQFVQRGQPVRMDPRERELVHLVEPMLARMTNTRPARY